MVSPEKKARKVSLVGTFHNAAKAVCPGKAFVPRISSTATKLCNMHFISRQNKSFAVVVFVLEWL